MSEENAESGPETPESPPLDLKDPRITASIDRYWRANVVIMTILLLVWAVVGLGCGILLADALNQLRFGGYPVGFWFAQQGSIIVFVLLILLYALLLNRLDAKHRKELAALRKENGLREGEGI